MFFDLFFQKDSEAEISKFVLLTAVIFAPPVFQTVVLLAMKFFHPIIKDVEYDKMRNISCLPKLFSKFILGIRRCAGVKVMEKQPGGYAWQETKNKYKGLCIMLKKEFGEKACWPQVKKWLEIKEINVMQYEKDDQDAEKHTIIITERKDGRMAKMRQSGNEFADILNESCRVACDGTRISATNHMMTVINHHINIVSWVGRMKQINYGMVISEHTDPTRKGSMEWRGVIDEVSKLEPGIRFPNVLRYNVIRGLSKDIDKNWNHSEKGTELDPHTLLLDPWGPLEANAKAFINSFLLDVWIYFSQIWFGVVVVGILFA